MLYKAQARGTNQRGPRSGTESAFRVACSDLLGIGLVNSISIKLDIRVSLSDCLSDELENRLQMPLDFRRMLLGR